MVFPQHYSQKRNDVCTKVFHQLANQGVFLVSYVGEKMQGG